MFKRNARKNAVFFGIKNKKPFRTKVRNSMKLFDSETKTHATEGYNIAVSYNSV